MTCGRYRSVGGGRGLNQLGHRCLRSGRTNGGAGSGASVSFCERGLQLSLFAAHSEHQVEDAAQPRDGIGVLVNADAQPGTARVERGGRRALRRVHRRDEQGGRHAAALVAAGGLPRLEGSHQPDVEPFARACLERLGHRVDGRLTDEHVPCTE